MAPFEQKPAELPGAPAAEQPQGQASVAASGGALSIDAQSSFMRERAAQRASEHQQINVSAPNPR